VLRTQWSSTAPLGVCGTPHWCPCGERIEEWADSVSLNPARVPPALVGSPAVAAAAQRFRQHEGSGLAMLAALAEMHPLRT